MIRQKKEYVCTSCGKSYLTWQGICAGCKKGGTLQEHVIIPVKVKTKATAAQKTVRRRWKTVERDAARSMIEADGADPAFKGIASSTGKIGHITNIQADAVSRTYMTEVKNRNLPAWLITAWIQIQQKADEFNKNALLFMDPPNMPRDYPVNGVKKKTGKMAVITQTRHEELIVAAKERDAIRDVLENETGLSGTARLKKIRDILGLNN